MPINLPPGTYDAAALNVTTAVAATECGVAVYKIDPTSGFHGDKIAETSTHISLASTGEQIATFDVEFVWPGGWVLVALAANTSSAGVTSATSARLAGMPMASVNGHASAACYGVFKATGDVTPNGADPTETRADGPLVALRKS